MTQFVIYGGGAQTLKTVPFGASGDPMLLSAATAKIVDLAHSDTSSDYTIEAQAAATVDSTTDTTTANVGHTYPEKREIVVSTPANFTKGNAYALVAADGQSELIRVDHVSSTSVFATDVIRGQFPTGSTLRGIEVSFTFPAATANSETEFKTHFDVPYAIDWGFTGGTPATQRELIWLRRHPDPVLATSEDVAMYDSAVGKLNAKNNKVENALAQAHRDIRREIRAHQVDTDTIHFGDDARDWVVRRTVELLRRQMGEDTLNAELAQRAHEEAAAIMGQLTGIGFGQVHTSKSNDAVFTDREQRLSNPFPRA